MPVDSFKRFVRSGEFSGLQKKKPYSCHFICLFFFTVFRLPCSYNRPKEYLHIKLKIGEHPEWLWRGKNVYILEACLKFKYIRDEVWQHPVSIKEKLYGSMESLLTMVIFTQKTLLTIFSCHGEQRGRWGIWILNRTVHFYFNNTHSMTLVLCLKAVRYSNKNKTNTCI